jgi:hypothetical protein
LLDPSEFDNFRFGIRAVWQSGYAHPIATSKVLHEIALIVVHRFRAPGSASLISADSPEAGDMQYRSRKSGGFLAKSGLQLNSLKCVRSDNAQSRGAVCEQIPDRTPSTKAGADRGADRGQQMRLILLLLRSADTAGRVFPASEYVPRHRC